MTASSQRHGDRIRITAESVGWLRRHLSPAESSAYVQRLELVVDDWRSPWPSWSGRLGPLPGLVHHEVSLPETGHGRATVRVALAAPVRLGRMVAAMLPVLEPWHPLPTPISPDLAAGDAPPPWLWAQASAGLPVGVGPRKKDIRPYDVQVVTPTRAGELANGQTLTGTRHGVAGTGAGEAIVVDATTANPRGRQPYGPGQPTGWLRLVAEADAVWWQIARAVDEAAIVVAGRVGDPLDERQRGVLAQLGAIVATGFPAAIPPPAAAAAVAQLAMTGAVLHAPEMGDAVAALLAPDLVALARASLPGRSAEPLQWELRGVAQRRAALRHHAAAFAWPRTLAGVYPSLGGPPTVSALLVSRRPQRATAALAALAAQSYPALEVVVGLHGCDLPAGEVERLAARSVPVQVVPIPARLNFGEALAEATRAAHGSLISKLDDDDLYGPEHVWDLVLARHYSGATVVGKAAEFVYLEPHDVTVRRYMGSEFYTDVVAGGAMLLSRGDLESVGGWRPLARAVDRALLDRVLHAGGLVYRTHALGFIYTRHDHGHTWDPGLEYFLRDPRSAWHGLPPYPDFGAP